MNINRHNYETFFLLYVDNELSATERKAVEQFVEENPDLKTELELLLETTLPDDMVSFNAKENLYKTGISQEALQENLLLQLDHELDPITAAAIGKTISSDNAVKNEWEILQRTKLDANEKIVFENKQVLYRYEKDRVISMRFWRIAAAAAILLLAFLYTGITLLKKDTSVENETAGKTTKQGQQDKIADISSPVNSSNDPKKDVNQGDPVITDKNEQSNNSTVIVPAGKNNTTQNKLNKKDAGKNDQLAKDEKTDQQKPSLENINKEKRNEIIASTVLKKNSEDVIENKVPTEIASLQVKDKITSPRVPVIDYNVIPVAPNDYAKTSALNETNPGNDNRILYINEEKAGKTKIGGLFRRVKRVIERNTNIKTGNGVTIAGFEIAVK